jgi:hypothetical protein
MTAAGLSSRLAAATAARGAVPLAWAGSTTKMDYLNFGDALSPVMVSLCTGLKVRRVPFKSLQPRLAAVGTIGHGLEGGAVWFWGTGSSAHRNPSAAAEERVAYAPPADTEITLAATRGPVSASLLGGAPAKAGAVFGDPVWLLPRFYPASVPKRYELGVILHLSELADRALEAHPHPKYRRYERTAAETEQVRLINTITPISAGGLRDKLDEILACKRIVSTSLHGMVIAESYGIPCLYFPPNGDPGLQQVVLSAHGDIDLRIVDLYLGLGVPRLPVYVQDRMLPTDWNRLMAAIDSAWQPRTLDGEALLHALPLPTAPIAPPPGGTVFEHRLIQETEFQHDVAALLRDDRQGTEAVRPPRRPVEPVMAAAGPVRAGTSDTPPGGAAQRLQGIVAGLGAVPLCWVAPTKEHPYPNLGDALSAVMVAGLAGLPVKARNFDDSRERLAAVGTIGHAMRQGHVHMWGTGVDAARFPGAPANTAFSVHAVRGPYTAAVLRKHGIDAPAIYGDPVWMLPRMLPRVAKPPRFDLGVIVHISELQEATAMAQVKSGFVRYRIPAALGRSIRIINTYTARSIDGLVGKVDEILECRRIASTSFHGILIGDAYGIPSIWFGTSGQGGEIVDTASPDGVIDHRVRDFYAACGETRRAVFRAERGRQTDWDAVINWIDQAWTPPSFNPEPLIEAFPLKLAIDPSADIWPFPLRAMLGLV